MDASSQSIATSVIVNAHSGGGHDDAWAMRVESLFRTHGMAVRVVLARDGAALRQAAKRAAQESGIVVAGGGDGTINCVASELVDTGAHLGVLPLGTLNHFAKDLGIPLELEEAVRTIAAAHVRRVDVGEVNDRIFLNNSSIGMYALMVRDRDRNQHVGIGKWPALLKASWKILNAYRAEKMQIVADGQAIRQRTPLVFVGNNAYVLSGFRIGARETLDAGTLSLYVVPRDRRWSLIWLAIRALFGKLHQDSDFHATTANEIVIRGEHDHASTAIDGEVESFAMPLRYRIRKQALSVIVPEPSS